MTSEELSPLDEIVELVEDLAFEIAHKLDWVDLVRRNLPPLTPAQERTLRDMADAFAAGQLLERELDGQALSATDRRFVREVVLRLGGQYTDGLEAAQQQYLNQWSGGGG